MSADAPLRPPRPMLWFGVAGGPLGWGVQEMLGWYFASAPCSTYTVARHLHGQPTGLLGAIHVVLILVGVAAFLAALSGWRRTRSLDPVLAVLVDRYLGAIGMVVSLVTVLAMIWAGLGTVMLAPCESMR